MPLTKPPKTSLLILHLLLVFSSSFQVEGISIFQCRTLISLSHSVMNRISELRASRGDYEGSQRAKSIANKLEGGLSLYKDVWSISWDYLRNYAWRHISSSMEMFQSVSDLNQLLIDLNELTQLKSGKERTDWVLRNYQKVLLKFKSLFGKLLQVFIQSVCKTFCYTLVYFSEAEGDLLRDCLELGSSDLKGLLRVFNDLVVQFSGENSNGHGSDL
ncbi:Adenine phosphoribosyltransferase [Thalictrum thalictroides]|uniref:Adenine phosphoribosyltransferase n=1 Tax=Thalictrum thalictroides TaxID=46969 RepID=A0A7J6UVY6_THATH|nr:Adenine phosphoribosyltransferase [Thalictrum thalictroides]